MFEMKVPPRTIVGLTEGVPRSGCCLSPRPAQSAVRRSSPASTAMAFWIALTPPPSRQCGWFISAWAERPSTVNVPWRSPRVAIQRLSRVGSGTSPASPR